ncbi:TrkH family potassium uptake protein [bacterium]|nr:TrkH family potassium uptake protein [bacterium]
MWPRLRTDDVKAIVHYLGMLVLVIGALMVIPLVVALLRREWNPAVWFALSIGVTASIGAAMNIVRPVEPGLSHKQALVVTGLAWIVGAAATALPLYLSGNYASYFDALFNAISYLSGTGMSLIKARSVLPVSLAVWRCIMVSIGAMGIVLVAMGLGTISRFAGAGMMFKAEGHYDKIMPQMAGTSRFIAIFMGLYIAVGTLACAALLVVDDGFSPAYALLHGFSLATNAVATSGTTLSPTGIAYYHSAVLNALLCVLMLVGTFSFALYFFMARKGAREFFRDIETRTIVAWGVFIAVLLGIALPGDAHFGGVSTFFDKGAFNLVSAITGTGYCTFSSAQIAGVASSAVVFVLVIGMLMGGATSSTAGGFKAIRLALALRTIVSEIRRSLMPQHAREAIRFRHFGDQTLTPDLSRNVMLVLLMYVFSFAFGSVLGVAYGYDPIAAVLESVSCTANCGMSSGIITPGMPTGLKVCYFVQMLAGRLEFLTLLTTIASILVSASHAVSASRLARRVRALVPAPVRRAWHGQGGQAPTARGGRGAREPRAARDVLGDASPNCPVRPSSGGGWGGGGRRGR